MTTNHKIKKAVARRERIRKEKAARKISNAVGRKAAKTEWSLFKDTTQFFNTVLNDYGNLVYRKEQIRAGIVGEIKRITDLKNEDPEKYEKLNTKVYDDCLAELDNDVQPKLKSLAQLVDKFKDNPVAGADRLTSALDASQMLSGIVTSLGDVVNKAESYYTTVKDTIEGIEHHETNPIAEEAKNQTEAEPGYTPAEVTDSADRTPETQQLHDVTIEADADALNKIIDAQADSKPDVVVNPSDIVKKEETMNTVESNPAEGNTFKDQEVDVVATPAAAKGNTNTDQEVSVDADTVNKILNEQNGSSAS